MLKRERRVSINFGDRSPLILIMIMLPVLLGWININRVIKCEVGKTLLWTGNDDDADD